MLVLLNVSERATELALVATSPKITIKLLPLN